MPGKKGHILLGVTGSIAAVKAPILVRLLLDRGYEVDCVLTPSAERFVTPLSLATLIRKKVYTDLFGEEAYQMPHLDLAKKTNLLVIAPATATMLGRLARGLGEDLISLTYLTTTSPTFIAPAMHDTMWLHPANQENVEILKKRGVSFLGPVEGKLADQNQAIGRMAEPEEIVKAIENLLARSKATKQSHL